MKERPILFSAPMVKAILEGRKTQTRRVVKSGVPIGNWEEAAKHCPYGQVGNELWVRETFFLDDDQIYYRADGDCCAQIPECQCFSVGKPKNKPSIFMPRCASRITLEITNIRIERLQDISEEDAVAEGMQGVDGHYWADSACGNFREIWKHINGEESWNANPWVWVIGFSLANAPESAAD